MTKKPSKALAATLKSFLFTNPTCVDCGRVPATMILDYTGKMVLDWKQQWTMMSPVCKQCYERHKGKGTVLYPYQGVR